MLDFIIRGGAVKGAQGYIDRLNPKVQIHIHPDAPLPSIDLVKKLSVRASQICALESKLSQLTNEELKAKTLEFKTSISQFIANKKQAYEQLLDAQRKASSGGEREDLAEQIKAAHKDLFEAKQVALDKILNEAFAVVRETGKRVLNMRHFDVQLVGGMVLHSGAIAEMTTGEGKTLVATLPAYLNALTGDGVHVVTVNDYLAKRDRAWMGPVYEFLGLTVGCIQHGMAHDQRQSAYGCDITYATNNELGFDYLRDNMVSNREEMVQRRPFFAIVDEVDSILVDEARTPLIISGPAEESTDKYYKAYTISKHLMGRRITEQQEVDAKHKGEDLYQGYDYLADEKNKSISLSEDGERKAAEMFGVKNLHDIDTVEYRHHIICALRAREFFVNDVDYVVKEGKVIIVDEFTGRMMPGRRWSDGLHQAVEAKEGIKIERENQTLATITFQNYFRMYQKLAGMTGTAYTEANEFKQIYNLDVVVIPTNRPLVRQSFPDCIYKTQKEKYDAVVEEIAACHAKGQPVLVGTISIEKSELIGRLLKTKGIPHQVLNAKYHEMEANIIAQAGRLKGVTIATNMAGRGTDIMLGGNADFLARAAVWDKVKDSSEEEREAAFQELIGKVQEQTRQEREQVRGVGGLHVIGTERHESRRIDNQLRGRCGRQGDPGSSRFYVSLQDDLMRLFASDRMMFVMDKLGMEEGQVIESRMVSGALEVAQKRVENYNFEIRKQLLEYDNVMNKQREVIYALRRSILEGENLKDVILDAMLQTSDAIIDRHFALAEGGHPDGSCVLELSNKFSIDLKQVASRLDGLNAEELKHELEIILTQAYDAKEAQLGVDIIRRMERMVLLHVIDTKWKEHLHAMDQLKDGISLRAFGQRDPLVEYKKEGFSLFKAMYEAIYADVAGMMFRLQTPEEQERHRSVFADLPQQEIHQEFISNMQAQAGGVPGQMPEQSRPQVQAAPRPSVSVPSGPKAGRNDPCPCGSGKKYKKCCGQ